MIEQEFLRGLATLIAGLIIALVGLWAYFRQKEYELVKQRYLEQGIDVVAAEVEGALGVYSQNWARCLQTVKEYRDMKERTSVDQLSSGFIAFNTTKFQMVAHHRIKILTNSDLIWNVYQLALVFAERANTLTTREIPGVIRLKLEGEIEKDHSKIAEECFSELNKIQEESYQYSNLTHALQIIAIELEQQRFSYKAIGAFSKRPGVAQALRQLKFHFSEALSPYADNTNPNDLAAQPRA